MNIVVLMKQTFDTEEKIEIEDGRIKEEDAEFVINPYDEYAVEEAVRIKEEVGGEVTVVSAGPDRAEKALRTALAMGADRALLIDDERIYGGDEFVLGKGLAAAVKTIDCDLILAGNVSIDNGAGQVAVRVAEELDIPHVATVMKLELDHENLRAERDAEGDVETVETTLPALITAQQGLNEPRYPSLPGIMKAKKKSLQRLRAEDLQQPVPEAKTEVTEQYVPEPKAKGKILEGELEEQVQTLVRELREKARVI